MQDYSTEPLDRRDEMFEAIRQFSAVIRKAGAKPALFMTWARAYRPGDQDAVAGAYLSIGHEIGATVVPVGVAWSRAREEDPKLSLYQWDGSHPTAEGSYLAACCFDVALLGADPRGLTPPMMINADTAQLLQRVAWETSRPIHVPATAPLSH